MVFLVVGPGSVRVVLAEGLCDWGGTLRLKASVTGRRAVPLFSLCPAFALQLRKSTENLSQGSRAARGLLVAPTWLSLRDCLGWPAGRQITPVSQVNYHSSASYNNLYESVSRSLNT
jgi:hypothetical protein